MGITANIDEQGIAEVVMDNPPVNALNVAGWFDLARIIRDLGEQADVRVVVLRAEGRQHVRQCDGAAAQARDVEHRAAAADDLYPPRRHDRPDPVRSSWCG